ncbi:hypothetical protein OIU79_021490 [Salix purpurea]|uniref:Uncharacterized protein n=1 Tax=Salix purpurea TaxID=77065 RepID=A0A9Q0WPK8_SALPP|nr:hypothetical protein OIU79_021490 [Salix purpurea]
MASPKKSLHSSHGEKSTSHLFQLDHQLLLSHFKRATTPSKKQLHAKFVVSGLLGHHPLSDRRLLESYVTVLQIYYAVSILREYPDVS